MSKKRRASDNSVSKSKREPRYGVDKAKLPKKWIQTREAIENEYSLQVKKWYFPLLIILALLLFTLSLVIGSIWLALLAGVLTVALAYWNKAAGEERNKE